MGESWALFAQAVQGQRAPGWRPDSRLWWASLALIATLLAGAVIIALIDRWRKRRADDALTPDQQLEEFRVLYERGELSAEEYERVRAALNRRLRRALDLPPPPLPTPPPAPPSGGVNGSPGSNPL